MARASKRGDQPRRLPSGGLVDRNTPVRFEFDGRALHGFQGDTLASALIANGVDLVGRSFKYHRPRGILAAGSEEPNALVELRTGGRREPNTRATTTPLYDGLTCRSQNRWPSLSFDVLSVNSAFSPLLGAGFYYKTFMWPAAFWEKIYEPVIRRAAGLGSASREPDPDAYEKAWLHCDVLVIGGGPTGLMAALAAARSGARVVLCDDDFVLGGRLNAEDFTVGDMAAAAWAAATAAELNALPNVRLMPRTTVFGVYDQNTYGAVERVNDHVAVPPPFEPRLRGWRIVAKRAVLATGAIERPIAFADNDRPGVMLASAVRTYIKRFGVRPGESAIVFTTGDDGWRTARMLRSVGANVILVDPRDASELPIQDADFEVIAGGVVERAIGGRRVYAVEIRYPDGTLKTEFCDLVAVSNGWNPSVHLTCHLGAKPVWNAEAQAFVAKATPAGMSVGGAAASNFTLTQALSDGVRLGQLAAADTGFERTDHVEIPTVAGEEGARAAPRWHVAGGTGKAFVDLQNDVTTSDIALALREGFSAAEHVKRYTTLGMATDQGKTANVLGLGVISDLTGQALADVGTTVFRPPYTPIALGALAGAGVGQHFRPARLTPTHRWAEQHGAVFTEVGLWLRAQYFPQASETGWAESVAREVNGVRTNVGICDVTTLGKIDIQGADAAQFLDRVYVNTLSSLALGKVRYVVMLREDGIVLDDGTVCRLGETQYLATTTTANAAKILEHLEFCSAVLWPELDVSVVPVTEQWAQIAVAGPKSRALLERLVDDPGLLSDAALPFMGSAEIVVRGQPCRVFRVSFCGELAYEVAIAADYGEALAHAMMTVGADLGITPYGTEALGVMRIEKGHAAGPELDGRTTLADLGLAKMGAKKQTHIGAGLATRPGLTDPARPALVGIIPISVEDGIAAGAHLIAPGAPTTSEHDEGHVSSAAYSPTLGHDVALCFLVRGRERIGDEIRAVDLLRGNDVLCRITDPTFVDPKGERLRG